MKLKRKRDISHGKYSELKRQLNCSVEALEQISQITKSLPSPPPSPPPPQGGGAEQNQDQEGAGGAGTGTAAETTPPPQDNNTAVVMAAEDGNPGTGSQDENGMAVDSELQNGTCEEPIPVP